MIYELFVNNYRKEIDSDKTPVVIVGRPTEKNQPSIQLIDPGISREQGHFYLANGKLIYEDTGRNTPEIINGARIGSNPKSIEMTLDTIIKFGDIFTISRKQLSQKTTEKDESSSDDPKTMVWN